MAEQGLIWGGDVLTQLKKIKVAKNIVLIDIMQAFTFLLLLLSIFNEYTCFIKQFAVPQNKA